MADEAAGRHQLTRRKQPWSETEVVTIPTSHNLTTRSNLTHGAYTMRAPTASDHETCLSALPSPAHAPLAGSQNPLSLLTQYTDESTSIYEPRYTRQPTAAAAQAIDQCSFLQRPRARSYQRRWNAIVGVGHRNTCNAISRLNPPQRKRNERWSREDGTRAIRP